MPALSARERTHAKIAARKCEQCSFEVRTVNLRLCECNGHLQGKVAIQCRSLRMALSLWQRCARQKTAVILRKSSLAIGQAAREPWHELLLNVPRPSHDSYCKMYPSELKLKSLGHCYIHLPETFVSQNSAIKGGAIISVNSIRNDHVVHVIWDGQLTAGEHVELDIKFAHANKFEDELVIIHSLDNPETNECSSVSAQLVRDEDYAILSQHSDLNLLDTCKLVTRDLILPAFVSQNVHVELKIVAFQPADKQFGVLTKWTEVSILHNLKNVPETRKQPAINDRPRNELAFLSSVLKPDSRPRFHLGSLLICGERGAGKTHFMESILSDYKQIHSEYLNCKQLRGKRPEAIKKKFSEMLALAFEKQPSIVALDDIDSFLGHSPRHEEEQGQEVLYKKRLVDTFCDFLKQVERKANSTVLVIASSRSLDTLDKRIAEPEGRRYFNEIIKIAAPNLSARVNIIRDLIREHGGQIRSALDDVQLNDISHQCHSFMPSDLRKVFERALLCACSRSSLDFTSEPVILGIDDFIRSLEGYVPMGLRTVELQAKTTRKFEDVGGMAKIKDSLRRTVLMPLKYPKLYRRCPIKPQNSVLLYGPPGCGKTLIAEALINSEGLNSICVRGPELLSKYIGASEAAVRDLFRRAQLARPCVIFFDEFESLVARRGADSTGVTDRVVNQFLTVLDGVERLSHDVFIVAATSRPDMIDPAMLRPGRLDKHIYCPLPECQDRLEIIKVLSREMSLDKDVDLPAMAYRLAGFTGADIQSFLFSAQLKALHEVIDARCAGDALAEWERNDQINIVISAKHLNSAFDEMADSVKSKLSDLLNRYPATIGPVQRQRVAMRATLA